MHSSSLPGPPAATISPSISPSPAAPSSPSRAAGPAGAGSPYVSRWTYSWSAAALRTLGNRWPSSSMTARSNSVRRLPRACSSSSTCIVSEAMMAAISLVDGDTAERIAWCSRPTNGAEAAPLRTSPGGGVRSGSSTRASRSCSVMRSSGSDRRASVRCSSRRLSRSSPTSWSSRTPACARCLLSAARAPRRVDSVMPPAETLSPRSAGLRYAGKESSRTVMGKHADGTRKSAASAGARQPGSAEWTNRRCSDPWDCTRGRGSRSTSARVVAANSQRAHHALAQAGQRGAQFDPVGRRVLGRRERAGRRGVPRWRQRQAQQWQHGGHGRLAHPAANVPPVVHLVVIEGREDGPDHAQVQADGQAIAAGLGCVSAQTECAAHLDERAHCVAARLRVAELGNRLRSGRGHERLNRQFKRRPQLRRGQRAYGESHSFSAFAPGDCSGRLGAGATRGAKVGAGDGPQRCDGGEGDVLGGVLERLVDRGEVAYGRLGTARHAYQRADLEQAADGAAHHLPAAPTVEPRLLDGGGNGADDLAQLGRQCGATAAVAGVA
eukprot:scaffold7963_cov116-Isochrysis_galbana.AAC.20